VFLSFPRYHSTAHIDFFLYFSLFNHILRNELRQQFFLQIWFFSIAMKQSRQCT
jgi:hypothetical protein